MEQEKEIDLAGFLMRAISMTDKALDDAKVAILDVEDPNTYDVAINKIAYATGLIDSSRELINFIQDEGLEKIMLNINQNWYSRLAFLEELLEEQKPIVKEIYQTTDQLVRGIEEGIKKVLLPKANK